MENNYLTSCAKCGKTEKLMMVAHRNESGLMIGFIFSCSDCFTTISGGLVEVVIKLSDNTESQKSLCLTRKSGDICDSRRHVQTKILACKRYRDIATNSESTPCFYCIKDKGVHLKSIGNVCCPNCKRQL